MTRHSLRGTLALSSLAAAGLLAAGSASAKEVTLDLGHADVKVGWQAPYVGTPPADDPTWVPPKPENPILLERHPVSYGGIMRVQYWSGDEISVSASGAAVTLSLDPGFGISAFTSNAYSQSSRFYFIDFLANATLPFAFVADEGYVIDGYRVSLQTSYHDNTQGLAADALRYEGSFTLQGTAGGSQALSLDAQDQAYGYDEGVVADLLTIQGSFKTDGDHTSYWYAYSEGFEISAIKIEVLTSPVAVPEPQTWALLVAGLGLTVAAARRRG